MQNIFTAKQCQGSRFGIHCIRATTYLVQQFVLLSICKQYKDITQYALFDILDFWKFQLRISPLAITIYLVQPKLGAAMYINESFQQHKDMSQNLLFDILEFWKFWPRIPSLITTTYGMPFKLGAVVCDNRSLPTAQT